MDMRKIFFTLFIFAFVSCLCFAQEPSAPVTKATPEPMPVDPTVSLLLSCDGAYDSKTFTDRSDNRHAVTAHGDARVSTSQKNFGTGSAVFDGDGDYLTVEDSADWDFGMDDFTIDFWIRFKHKPSEQFIFDVGGSQTESLKGVGLYYINDEWWVAVNNKYPLIIKGKFAINKWYHIAIVRSGGTLYLFQNGRLLKKTANAEDITGSTEGVTIGTWCARDNYFFDGWIDEFRICKGVARWTASFTPPAYNINEAIP